MSACWPTPSATRGGGYAVSASEGRYKVRESSDILAMPAFKREYCDEKGEVRTGAIRKHPRLADTLEHLSRAGLSDYYKGDIAREIAADLEEAGSPVTRVDLSRYAPRLRQPLTLDLPGVRLYNFPPPTHGVITLMLHGVLEKLGNPKVGSLDHVHALIEAIKRGYHLRDRTIADPLMMSADPAEMLSDAALARHAAAIDMRRAASTIGNLQDGDTIWMGAIDRNGLAVSMIQSIFWDYGSGLLLPKTGVLMQNRGYAFSLDPKSHRALAPGRFPSTRSTLLSRSSPMAASCPTAPWAGTPSRRSLPRISQNSAPAWACRKRSTRRVSSGGWRRAMPRAA